MNTDSTDDLVFASDLAGVAGCSHQSLRAGLMLTGFYEDRYAESDNDPLSAFLDTFIATRAVKR